MDLVPCGQVIFDSDYHIKFAEIQSEPTIADFSPVQTSDRVIPLSKIGGLVYPDFLQYGQEYYVSRDVAQKLTKSYF